MSLLDNAKKVPTERKKNKIGAEEIELALAWARDEITMGQITVALKIGSNTAYSMFSNALKQYIQDKKL